MIGTTVGSYRILSKLSVGGMGTVYRAEHTLIGKLAAVKVLNPELCTNEEVVQRFLNEAKATTTIKHPGIVEVFDFGHMASGHAYLTMEFLEGVSLGRRLTTHGKMSEGEAAMLLRGVCSALSAAHAKGIVHRDLKPDNIFLVADPDSPTGERPKLLDFGIAKLTDVGRAGATKTGAVMGTPTYMSPEQCRGTGEVDHRADLYSLGCILFELVTGRPPFIDLGAGELIGAHLYLDPDPPQTYLPELSAETDCLIMALLDKDPVNRPQSARELGQRLTAIARHQGWITQTSPTGVTAPSLTSLLRPTPVPAEVDHSSDHTLPAPVGLTPAPAFAPAEKPTTLSGAASSMLDVPRRSRRGLGIAMAAAALIAGGTVALFQLRGGSQRPASAPTTTVAPAGAPAPRASEIAPAPVVTPPQQQVVAPSTPTEAAPLPATPAIEPAKPASPGPAIAAVKPTAAPQKPAKLPGKRPGTPKAPPSPAVPPPTPPKPKPTLIENDI